MSLPKVPTISQVFSNPVRAFTGTSFVGAQVAGVQAATGIGTGKQSGNTKGIVIEANSRDRVDALNAANNEQNIDERTRKELQDLYKRGALGSEISDVLNQARLGKGIFGVRKLNENQQKIAALMPGRSQLLSLDNATGSTRASGSSLGTGGKI